MMLSLWSLATAALAVTASAFPQSKRATACNNSPTLCDRAYNNVTHMGAHDSSFLRDGKDGLSAAGNQYLNATDALDAGLRLLQVQVHKANSSSPLEMCHTTCGLLDAGPLVNWLKLIGNWMDSNPNEVVTILIANEGSSSNSQFASAFKSAGLSDIAYAPSSEKATGDWPTLGKMISSKKRLVVFVTNIDASSDASYLLPEFNYVFETNFEVLSFSGFNCTLQRPSTLSSASSAISSNYMGLVNHFKYQSLGTDGLEVPDLNDIARTNSAGTTQAGNLGLNLQQCRTQWGASPNFVLVDFWNQGEVLKALDNANGISDATGRKTFSASDESSLASDGRQRSFGPVALLAFVAAAVLMV